MTEISARNRWVFAIVLLLAVNVGATLFLAITAGVPKTVPGYHELSPKART